MFYTAFYSTVHFITELWFLFPENSVMNILTKDTYMSQNMKCSVAVDYVNTESVDAVTEIRKGEKRK